MILILFYVHIASLGPGIGHLNLLFTYNLYSEENNPNFWKRAKHKYVEIVDDDIEQDNVNLGKEGNIWIWPQSGVIGQNNYHLMTSYFFLT